MSREYSVSGWDNLQRLVGVGPQVLFRWIKLYEFPKPTREGKRGTLVWDRRPVAIWVAKNKELVEKASRASKMRTKKKPTRGKYD